MPELFPNPTTFVLCALIVAGAQLIYATVGFGAGMFSIALLALLLPDLGATIATLFILTLVTEVWVLCHAWRQAKVRLLIGLLPTTAAGMWLGTELLAGGDASGLKRALGAFIVMAGAWFLYEERRRKTAPAADHGTDDNVTPREGPARSPGLSDRAMAWLGLPVGLASGTLAGLFGTGGPPVILFLKGRRLDKGAFRATLLWFFLLMGVMRAVTYIHAGLLTRDEVVAAAWLLPASLLGMFAGMAAHKRLSQRQFARTVSLLLIFLGVVLALRGGE